MTQILIRSILSWFTSLMMLTAGGIAIFSLKKFSSMKYHIAAAIIVGMFLFVVLFESVMHSRSIGLI